MMESLRHSIGLMAARYRFRRTRESVISFTKTISSSRTVLIVLPFNAHQVQSTAMVIDLLRRSFKGEDITVASTDHAVEVVRTLPRSQFVHILPDEISYFFLPRRELLNRILSKPYDLAIDLNLDFLLPSGYICRASGARVRVGFTRKSADIFYNFQIQADPTLARKLIYDRLANCLQKF